MSNAQTSGEEVCALSALGTSLRHVRCERPVLVERMVHSLCHHGQLTPVVVVRRAGRPEVLDGFKRLQGAKRLNWPSLRVVARELDEAAQWAAMLLLNRGPQSMTILEEALVLKELVATGLTQVQIGQLLQRHKSWVCRRIGLVDHLHPGLLEDMKLGLLSAGMARRLLSLPAGPQLEIAAAARAAGMTVHQTEKLVGLWHRSPEGREQLLKDPLTALAKAGPGPRSKQVPADPRLTSIGQEVARLALQVRQAVPRLSELLKAALTGQDLVLLAPDLRATRDAVEALAIDLGPLVSGD
jgi:ParB/RepB/Spo0J family partition protein